MSRHRHVQAEQIPSEIHPHKFWLGIFHNVGPDPEYNIPCTICQEDVGLDERSSRHTVCRNYFHMDCLEHWFEELDEKQENDQITCPMCRGFLHKNPYRIQRDMLRNDRRNDLIRNAYDVGADVIEYQLPSLELVLEQTFRRVLASELQSTRWDAHPADLERQIKLAIYRRAARIETLLHHEFGHEIDLELDPELFEGPAWTRHRRWRLESARMNRFLDLYSNEPPSHVRLEE